MEHTERGGSDQKEREDVCGARVHVLRYWGGITDAWYMVLGRLSPMRTRSRGNWG